MLMEPICASATVATIGALTVNGVLLHKDGCWNVLNPNVLWFPNANRGRNVVIAKASGQRAYPYRTDQSQYTLTIVVDGVMDWDGNEYDDIWVGLETNMEYLHDNVFTPPTAPLATYDATLQMPSGDVREAAVQCKWPDNIGSVENFVYQFDFPLIVPRRRFDPAASS